MNLEQLRQQNSLRTADINALLDELHTKLESVVAEHENVAIALKTAQEELPAIEMEKKELKADVETLITTQAEQIETHKESVAELGSQHDKLTKLIDEAQTEYTEAIQKRNALKDSLADDAADLKERELSLNAKVKAFKKEKEEFNFEKRKILAQEAEY